MLITVTEFVRDSHEAGILGKDDPCQTQHLEIDEEKKPE